MEDDLWLPWQERMTELKAAQIENRVDNFMFNMRDSLTRFVNDYERYGNSRIDNLSNKADVILTMKLRGKWKTKYKKKEYDRMIKAYETAKVN